MLFEGNIIVRISLGEPWVGMNYFIYLFLGHHILEVFKLL